MIWDRVIHFAELTPIAIRTPFWVFLRSNQVLIFSALKIMLYLNQRIEIHRSQSCCWFWFWFVALHPYDPVNSYGHVGTVSSPNQTFFLCKLEQAVIQYFVHILLLVTDNGSVEGMRMTVEIISWSISAKVWDRVGIELATPGSAARHTSVVRHVTTALLLIQYHIKCILMMKRMIKSCFRIQKIASLQAQYAKMW